jgi:hypothetical protein
VWDLGKITAVADPRIFQLVKAAVDRAKPTELY